MQTSAKNPRSVLGDLGFSESEVQVYLTLVDRGALTARELMMSTKAKRPTIYYALRQLMDRGLVVKRGTQAAERFQAEQPDTLLSLVKLRQQKLSALERDVADIIPQLVHSNVQREGAPGVLYYQGEEAMKRAIMDTLYCKSGHIDSIAPTNNFFWQVGQDFSASYVAERVQRKIKTRNLWEKPLEAHILASSYKGLSEIRLLPDSMHGKFRTTVFLYDQEVMYISSLDGGYVLVVKSREHYELMRAMYDALWIMSSVVKL